MHELGISNVAMMFAGAGIGMAGHPPLRLRGEKVHSFGKTWRGVVEWNVVQKPARISGLDNIIPDGADPVER